MTGLPSTPYPENPHPDIERVRVYWEERRPSPDQLPRRSDIHLMDLYDIAPHLLLADVIRDDDKGVRYFWRFGGTSLRIFFGFELTGTFIDEVYTDEAAETIQSAYSWILDTSQPHYWVRRGGLVQPDQKHLVYERYICPVTGGGSQIDHLFGIIVYPERPVAVGAQTDLDRARQLEIGEEIEHPDSSQK